jgi:hypothetical protein
MPGAGDGMMGPGEEMCGNRRGYEGTQSAFADTARGGIGAAATHDGGRAPERVRRAASRSLRGFLSLLLRLQPPVAVHRSASCSRSSRR